MDSLNTAYSDIYVSTYTGGTIFLAQPDKVSGWKKKVQFVPARQTDNVAEPFAKRSRNIIGGSLH